MNSLLARYLKKPIQEDLLEKMVFLGGPRQVGKTTLAQSLREPSWNSQYFNWDDRSHRQQILHKQWPPETEYLIFDEIHKYPKWKSLIKGFWDTRQGQEKIIVTGSSRLNIYRRGGDSLMGRYHYYCLHPFSLREMNDTDVSAELLFPENKPDLLFEKQGKDLATLFQFGGFPEPLLKGKMRTLKRWQKERFERIFREDIRDSENIRSLSQVELLGSLLPARVASPLSFSSLSEDLEVSPKTVKQWIDLLRNNYYIFQVMPYHKRLERALKKESKYYLWDWSEVTQEGARFENMVASHLLKYCDYYQHTFGVSLELCYLRDMEKREVDFILLWEKEPWFLVECKLSSKGNFRSLHYFGEKLGIQKCYLVTLSEEKDYQDSKTGTRVIPASKFFMALQ